MLKPTKTSEAPSAATLYSQAMTCGNLLFSSGNLPIDPKTGEIVGNDVTSQMEMIMKNIGAVLGANDIGFDQVIKTTCFLTDIADFEAFNKVYTKHFTADAKPARSTVAVRALPRGALCEVEFVADVG